MGIVNFKNITERKRVGGVALGNFDGVHLGHKELLNIVISESKLLSLPSAACTFSPHPRQFFKPDEALQRVYPEEVNHKLILKHGVSNVYIKEFDKDFSQKSPDEFFETLYGKIEFSFLVVGYNFRFGKNREGTVETLQNICDQNKVKLFVVEPVCLEGEKVSSTLIRKVLKENNLDKVRRLLGDEVKLFGKVRKDQGLGKQIGFPTLNIRFLNELCFSKGVYFSKIKHEGIVYDCISNLGVRPTVSEIKKGYVLETHILNKSFKEDHQFDELFVELLQFHRPESRFKNLDELKKQISKDILDAKEFFGL